MSLYVSMIRRMGAAVLALSLMASCSGGDADPNAPSRTDAAGSSESNVRILTASDCLESPCQGLLEPGEYRSTLFDPTVDFQVTSPGWTWDYFGTFQSGNFRLIADGYHEPLYSSDGIYFLVDPAIASRDCKETEEPGVGRSVDDLVAWLEAAPGLTVSEPNPVTIGGLDGVELDLRIDPTWKRTCFWSEGLPAVPLIINRSDVGGYTWAILPAQSMRWYVLDSDDDVMIVDIEDGPGGMSRKDLLRTGSKIVNSLAFSPPS